MNNARFYHAAYVVAAAVYVAYVLTLWWRGRALDRREAALDARRGAPPSGGGA